MTATLHTKDFLGRLLVNPLPTISDATDYLGRAVTAGATGSPDDDGDYLGRILTGLPGPG